MRIDGRVEEGAAGDDEVRRGGGRLRREASSKAYNWRIRRCLEGWRWSYGWSHVSRAVSLRAFTAVVSSHLAVDCSDDGKSL